jgi:hypothetical protein
MSDVVSSPETGPSSSGRRRLVIAAIAAALVLVLGVTALVISRRSGPDEVVEVATTTTEPPTTTMLTGPIAPLTGLIDPSGAVATRCVVTVKIGNTVEAHPQDGVEFADVVYEEEVEGGITRLAAIYHSQAPDRVGPVRSVRPIDPSIVWPLRGVFVYSGGAPFELASLVGAPVTKVDETAGGAMMFRDPARRAPHNLYAHVDQLYGRCGDPPPPPLFTYRPAALPAPGAPASAVAIGFTSGFEVTWNWDPASGTWRRSIFGQPDLRGDQQQLGVANVVVMKVHYTRDPENPAAKDVLIGEGPASVFTDGKVIEGRWVRPDRAAPAQLLDGLGQPIALTPGQTWVELPAVSRPIVVTP